VGIAEMVTKEKIVKNEFKISCPVYLKLGGALFSLNTEDFSTKSDQLGNQKLFLIYD